MNNAVRNEILASRQRMDDQYRVQLEEGRHLMSKFWFEKATALDGASLVATGETAPAVFKANVIIGLADSLIFFDDRDQVLYPGNWRAP